MILDESLKEFTMKLFPLMAILVMTIACGKDNKSGRPAQPSVIPFTSNYSYNEISLRKEFMKQASKIIRLHGPEINLYFRQDVASLMKARLRSENIFMSEAVIYNASRNPVHSEINNSSITLYVGEQYPDQNWNHYINYNQSQKINTDRLILHELFELADIRDDNFRHTARFIN
jgi:hypothetical protein